MKMEKRFYATRTPGQPVTKAFMKLTAGEAIEDAAVKARRDKEVYYVVQVIRVVKMTEPPVEIDVVTG